MKLPLLVSVICIAFQSVQAGTITGVVHAIGPQGAQNEDGGGGYASKKYQSLEAIDYDAIHDFVVYIDGPISGTQAPEKPAKVEQKNAEFVPHILPVMVGTTVDWPNDDTIFHNVFSKSEARPFNLGLYKKGDQPGQVIFDKPGEVDVFCAIHARMSCVVLVLENPCFAATDSRGRYSITNVPAGNYKLVAWQERLFSSTTNIVVPETGEVKFNFTLGPGSK